MTNHEMTPNTCINYKVDDKPDEISSVKFSFRQTKMNGKTSKLDKNMQPPQKKGLIPTR